MMAPGAIFLRSLERLAAMLDKIAASADSSLLAAQLHPDMLPFASQVRACCNFALRGCCPLAAVDVVSFDGADSSYASLSRQVALTMEHLRAIPAARYEGWQTRNCRDRAGFADLELSGDEYLQLYILPNFHFHLSMAYALARQHGVALGKPDYDGYHSYPPGFSFISNSA